MDNILPTIIDMYENKYILVSTLSITFISLILNGVLIYKLCTKTAEGAEGAEGAEVELINNGRSIGLVSEHDSQSWAIKQLMALRRA